MNLEEQLKAIEKVCEEIHAAGFGRKKGGAGVLKCPVCGNKFYYKVVGYNGHRMGACMTEGCLNFRE